MDEQVIHFETLAIANLCLTKKLLAAIATTGALDEQTITRIFESAADEMVRSTLPISPDGARQVLSLFLQGTGIDKRSVFTND